MANEDFISYIWPHAVAASEATGVDPRIIAGQAAVESGWGRHFVGNNLFGIKGPGVNALTTEVGPNGSYQTQSSFRSYASPSDSVSGYADFINANPRYGAFKNAEDVGGQLTALQRSGYATDPQYAGKVANAAAAIDSAVRKKDAETWSGQPGTPTDIKTALGYTGQAEPSKVTAVSDKTDDFSKDFGIGQSSKKTEAPTSPAGDQGDDFSKDLGIKAAAAKDAPAGQKSGSGAIQPGDTAAAIGSGIFDLPIVGPYVKEGALRAAYGIASVVNPAIGLPVRSLDEMRQWDAQLKQNEPYGYMGGQVLGGAAALLPVAATGAGAVALGARAPAFVTEAAGAIPALARLGTQAGAGGSTNALVSAADAYMRGEDPAMAAGVGGALGAAGPVVGSAALGAGQVGRSLIEPFVPGGPQRIADRFLAKAGAGAPLAIDPSKLGNVPGSTPTLAEATGNAGIAGIERGLRSTPEGIVPFNLRDTERQAARGELVSSVRGDPVTLAGMIEDRQAATDPLREAAFANAGKADPSNVVKKIDEILAGPEGKRDAVVNALTAIKSKLYSSGGTTTDPMAAITGGAAKSALETDPNQLYGVRKAIGDILDTTGPKTANDARLATSELVDIKKELDKSITAAAPKFSDYIEKFHDMSGPISTEKWMQALSLTDMRGNVTLGNVNRAIESTEKARLRGGANDAKIVPDEVMQKLYGLRSDLRSQLDAAERGRAVGSPTVQNLATQNFAQSAGIPLTTAATIASGHPMVGVPLHWLSRAIEARNPAVTSALVNRLLSPELPTSAAFTGGLPGAGMLNPGALLAPGLIPPNRNRLIER